MTTNRKRKALDLFAGLRRDFPNDNRYRSTEAQYLQGLAHDYLLAGEVREADAAASRARAALRAILAADPANADSTHTAVYLLARSSIIAIVRPSDLPAGDMFRFADPEENDQ